MPRAQSRADSFKIKVYEVNNSICMLHRVPLVVHESSLIVYYDFQWTTTNEISMIHWFFLCSVHDTRDFWHANSMQFRWSFWLYEETLMAFNIIVATSHNVKLFYFDCKLFISHFFIRESLVYIIATTAWITYSKQKLSWVLHIFMCSLSMYLCSPLVRCHSCLKYCYEPLK